MSAAPDLDPAIERIIETRRRVAGERCALVAISGIDASGKGYLSAKIAAQLRRSGLHVANINIDGWLNLPHVRFGQSNSAEHFYLHAIRFDDMFRQLIFPLRERGSLRLEMDFAAETATRYRREICHFENIDIILLEGIYLLKRQFQFYYDLSLWIDCSFDTALERALGRGQEGLSRQETIKAYYMIYFPAQQIHFQRDNPIAAANQIIDNESHVARPVPLVEPAGRH